MAEGKEKTAKGVKKQGVQKQPVEIRKDYIPRLKKIYEQKIIPGMMEKSGYTNRMDIPRLHKIVINMGIGAAKENPKLIDSAVEELALITGQRPVVTRARKAIASFKIKAGMPIGCMVTLRKNRMYEFLDRFINIALPRSRDFKGVSPKGFDGRGNYTLGIREEILFSELNIEKIEHVKGMNLTIVTSARTDEECRTLIEFFGMPFEKEKNRG
uniref:Large ribosomal subunit protein uL5 n=1 Tax=uncultured bacterium Rifle_16ft_4_minimus_4564 TaxID=1665161 RepID=A0A0H4T8P4_9BACT|nr:50S ribosomal protein L5, large subunit ribosomal protein L5 [uncultured bacterium Rifle_16ft_4_minimus_4564]